MNPWGQGYTQSNMVFVHGEGQKDGFEDVFQSCGTQTHFAEAFPLFKFS